MLLLGEIIIEVFVLAVFQEYVLAPETCKVADCPAQMVELFTEMVGSAFTMTWPVPVPIHPELLVPFTV